MSRKSNDSPGSCLGRDLLAILVLAPVLAPLAGLEPLLHVAAAVILFGLILRMPRRSREGLRGD